ncbi:MAG TPA: alpha/beta hydrolase [Longimicrobiales bacterium]|nr:alpha/beta hydrolase [Longimicrobiales bacterium]
MVRNGMTVVLGGIVLATALVVQRPRAQTPDPVAESTMDASALRFNRVRLSTGIELEVAERGPVDGKPVLFLHGMTDSWFSYSRILDNLPANIRAIVPTQRGHGDSEKPECCYRIPDFARDAVALLDALGSERANVVGHSMGSFIAQRIAIDYPDRVDRLALIGSGTTVATPPVIEFSQVARQLTDPIAESFVRDFQVSTAHKPLPPEFLTAVVNESMKVPARVWRSILDSLLNSDAKGELSRIRANTLIMWGEQDVFWDRSEQNGLLRAIPRARLITYADVAHAPHWEQPDRFLADLLNFLTP